MTCIELHTSINASIEICFNLSRSVETHLLSTKHTNEKVIDGRTDGLFVCGDTVTWKAKHFGVYHKLQMKITEMSFPYSFEDCMVKGIFKKICHRHLFNETNGITIMSDLFYYEVPYGFAGRWFNKIVLRKYMTKLLLQRNNCIKALAESERGNNTSHCD